MRETPRPTEEPCFAIVLCMLCLFFLKNVGKAGRMAVPVGSSSAVFGWGGGKAQSGIEEWFGDL